MRLWSFLSSSQSEALKESGAALELSTLAGLKGRLDCLYLAEEMGNDREFLFQINENEPILHFLSLLDKIRGGIYLIYLHTVN